MKEMPTKPKGAEKRLCFLTYSKIADWVGLESKSVQQYASRGEFEQTDIESVLRWVNGRRAEKGLPMIGEPGQSAIADCGPVAELLPPFIASKDAKLPEDVEIDWIGNGSPLPGPASGGYNPLTGDYDR